jgi:hypothetical protein
MPLPVTIASPILHSNTYVTADTDYELSVDDAVASKHVGAV